MIKKKIQLKIFDKVFKPTGTSELLVEISNKIIKEEKKILDLGCGCGIVGISIAKKKKIKRKIYFSDVSEEACKNTQLNCNKLSVKSDVRKGSLFEPWKNTKFDVIVSDVAAIASEVSKISPWYNNCVNGSGYDGTKHVIKFIMNAKNFLNKKGKIIFPIISLSNEKKIKSYLKKSFSKIKLETTKEWPMPTSMYKREKLLQKLKNKKIIFYKKKFGLLIFKTQIYSAQ